MRKNLEVDKIYIANLLDDKELEYQVPFKVLSINAYDIDADKELVDLTTDITLRYLNGFLNHSKYDIDIDLSFDTDLSIDFAECLENFTIVSDKEQLQELTETFKAYNNYISGIEDKLENIS